MLKKNEKPRRLAGVIFWMDAIGYFLPVLAGFTFSSLPFLGKQLF
jgi:hypothetical protein